MENRIGKVNIAVGLSVMAGFMVYGFFLIYMTIIILLLSGCSQKVSTIEDTQPILDSIDLN